MSDENLLQVVVPRPQPNEPHIYATLSTTHNSSMNRIVPCNPQSGSSYLHPQASRRSSLSSLYNLRRPRSERTDRRRLRVSHSSSRRTEHITHRFKKLKICVGALCIVNVCIALIFILTHPKLSPFSSEEDDFFTTGDGEPKDFKLCTKCQPLEAKVGFAGDIVEDIRSSKYPDFCCFRRVDQLLALFDGYAEKYVEQEVHVRQVIRHNITGVRNTDDSPPVPLAHLYYKDTGNSAPALPAPLTWETSGVDIVLQGDVGIRDERNLYIPRSGYYYVYSHLQINPGKATSHSIMKNHEKGNQERILQQVHREGHNTQVSELQAIFLLKKGDTLTVLANAKDIRAENRGNYFGVFILEK